MSDLREKRIKKMEDAVKELEEIEAFDEVILDDFAPNTAQSGQIVASLPSESWTNSDRKKVFELEEENLRSVAQLVNNALKNSEVFNFAVYEKPKKVYRYDDKPLGYDRDYYLIEVVP